MSLPAHQTALVTRVADEKAHLVLSDIGLPALEDHQVLVRNQAIAQNPTDVQSLDLNAFGDGAVLGCDFCGIVVAVGKAVSNLKIGDRIAALIWGGELPGSGAYSEYTVADSKICFKVPEGVSSTEAVTVPLAAATAWLALYASHCLSIPRNQSPEQTFLIWGGSSSVGLYALQLARLHNIHTITTCSPKHFELVKRMGASLVFDYNDPDLVSKIKVAAPTVGFAFDCIGNASSSALASRTIMSEGGRLCTVRPGKVNTENVVPHVIVTDVLVFTAFYKDHSYKEVTFAASKEDHDLASAFYAKVPELLTTGKLVPKRTLVLRGGLEAVAQGFQMHREGKISGFKIVYQLEEPNVIREQVST